MIEKALRVANSRNVSRSAAGYLNPTSRNTVTLLGRLTNFNSAGVTQTRLAPHQVGGCEDETRRTGRHIGTWWARSDPTSSCCRLRCWSRAGRMRGTQRGCGCAQARSHSATCCCSATRCCCAPRCCSLRRRSIPGRMRRTQRCGRSQAILIQLLLPSSTSKGLSKRFAADEEA